VAACLASCLDGTDEELLAGYSRVEHHEAAIPCDLADLFVRAAQARLRTVGADAVLNGHIPDSLAALSDPGVRRVLGLAYAQRAARNAEHDVRAALSDLDQALELLGGQVET
jgi:hypothetical protein